MIQEFLRAIPLFQDLEDDDLAQLLMVTRARRYGAGSLILAEGQPGGELHCIREGRVRISKVVPGVGEEALAILEPGDFFGELEFFDGLPASAHAVAHTDCELLSVAHADLRELARSKPQVAATFLWAFGVTLSRRLRDTNQKMATLFAISRTG